MTVKARRKHDIIKVKGTAKYPHLNQPNKRFDTEFGSYTCDLIIDEETKQHVTELLKPLYEAELREVMEQNAGKKIQQRGLPFTEVDGGYIMKTKLPAGGRRKDTNEIYKLSMPLYDASGTPLPEEVQIWGGSKLNLAVRPRFYYTAMVGFGVTFDLQAAQVIELVNGGVGEKAADAFGFTSEEGYIANGGEDLTGAFDAEETEETTLTANF